MTIPRIEGESYFAQEEVLDEEQLSESVSFLLSKFKRIVKSHLIFHASFFALGIAELFFIFLFFNLLSQSFLIAFSLAFVFLTIFSYFILRIYFQTKKPQQLKEIKEKCLNACKGSIRYREGVPACYVALARACCKLANSLHHQEYVIYSLPSFLRRFKPYIEKLSCFLHWQDAYDMKELFLLCSVEENIKFVKCEPTNLEAHAALANAYVMLSGLYVNPSKIEGFEEEKWIPSYKYDKEMEMKFRFAAERAIEEFKILSEYAPHDPWVHAQLAYSYHDLQMPEEEIREYETLLKFNPDDKDILFKLGVLYFQQGANAQGLRIYEELKRCHYKKAERLIKYYGAYEIA